MFVIQPLDSLRCQRSNHVPSSFILGQKNLCMYILKLNYFCFVHYFVHRTVSRFEAENVVISEMKENFSFCENSAGVLIIFLTHLARLARGAPGRLLSSPFSYLRHTKVVKG